VEIYSSFKSFDIAWPPLWKSGFIVRASGTYDSLLFKGTRNLYVIKSRLVHASKRERKSGRCNSSRPGIAIPTLYTRVIRNGGIGIVILIVMLVH
jgi:hypothetical protein